MCPGNRECNSEQFISSELRCGFSEMEKKIESDRNQPVVIIGAGITGCTLALYLGQRGYKVHVYDKRENFIDHKKRTVGMSISERGITTLKDLGIYYDYRSILVPKYGRAVHLRDGSVFTQLYGKEKEAIHTVNRQQFNTFLKDCCLVNGNVQFFFNHQFYTVRELEKKVVFTEGNKNRAVAYSYLFGCDGAFSSVRTCMQKKGLIQASLARLHFRFREIFIPPKEGEYVLDPHFVHIWNFSDCIFVGLPDGKKGFNGTLFYQNTSELNHLTSRKKLNEFWDANKGYLHFLDKEQFISEFEQNPESEIFQVTSSQWNHKGDILLMGDAAHAMPPFYAMGMNTCLESVHVFADLLDKLGQDLDTTIREFTNHRLADVEAMKKMARNNYDKLQKSRTVDFDKKWNQAREMMIQSGGEYETEYFQIAFTNKPFSSILKLHTEKENIQGQSSELVGN